LLIAGGQRAEHYEMAAYGTLIAWARVMGHTEAVQLLEQNLEEEKAADQKLSQLAENGINARAAANAHGPAGEGAKRSRAGNGAAASPRSTTGPAKRAKSSKTKR
jgi:hypothetical protein